LTQIATISDDVQFTVVYADSYELIAEILDWSKIEIWTNK